ncbi:uncharacterized protein LOC114324600 isoform X1 [Diabrotica virgifera virgifera]|uniref:Osiris 10 n=1 Tax=Diabrotica virgifera virgifera TaxID=50390 RepID=A0ABM5KJI3_DIAVI|nr:uncharacterized protein LOC114324600 isoform X1 [Diabrotica virgifera virgifera]
MKFAGAALTPNESTIGGSFRQCLISQTPANLGHCLGVEAITRLQSLDNSPEFDLVDGLTLSRDARQEYRDGHNFAEGDPSSFRSIMDSFSYVFSKRNMRWNMGFIYPGLIMHVAPSLHPGGTLEFAVDPHREAINVQTLKEAGTGRLLARQFLLPFLLGFKFNIISILPVIFGIVALIAKKALIISKFALILSSAFALGTLVFGYGQSSYPNQQYTSGHYTSGQYGNHGHHGHYGHFGHGGHGHGHGIQTFNKFPDEDYSDSYFRETNEANADQLTVFPNVVKSDNEKFSRTEEGRGRNFAWEDEKKLKEKSKPV